MLQIVTFGFYRFWLLTDLRRHLWSATHFGGDAIEYTGRARDLLIGFLIALAILAPAFFLYFLFGLVAESWRSFASVPLYGFLFAFGQYASYRARRYRLSRTVWRGLRFSMDTGAWTYAALSVCLGLASLATLGLVLPWRSAILERYKFRRTFYGDIPARFVGAGWGLFKSTWVLWLLVLTFAGLFLVEAHRLRDLAMNVSESTANNDGAAFQAGSGMFLSVIAIGIIYLLYLAIEWRWFLKGVRLGGLSVDSDLRTRTLLVLYFKAGLAAVAVALGFFAVLFALFWLIAAFAPSVLNGPGSFGNVAALVLTALGYLVCMVVIGSISRHFLQHNLWRAIVDSLAIEGLNTIAVARQAGKPADALGEGMLDGLDMGGF